MDTTMQTMPQKTRQTQPLRFVELFAGIGGFRLGIEKAIPNAQCVYANDFDKYAAQTYEKNFGHKPDTRDIRAVAADDIPSHELLVGGFPCPDFSIAGKRAGFGGQQGDLFFEVLRILKTKRTPYFILENVRGLLNHEQGQTFQAIIDELGKLGYKLQWFLLDSQNFGVPQQRKRIFIIGNLGGYKRPEIFSERQGYKGNDPQKSKVGARGLCLTTRSGQRQDPTAESFIGYCLNTKDRGVGQIWNETHIARIDTNGKRTNARVSKRLDRIRGRMLGNAVTVNVVEEIMKRF